MRANIDTLTAMNLADLYATFGVAKRPWLRWVVTLLGWWPSRRLAQHMAMCDAQAGAVGLVAAGRVIVSAYAQAVDHVNPHHVPRHGPVLICSNHPGLSDAAASFVAIDRPDLKVIAAERALLDELPNIAAQLICVPDDATGRAQAIRAAAHHLKRGGALLTYPAGRIESDPAVFDDAAVTLPVWSEMATLFGRLVPDLVVVPVLVSGVISARALDNWYVRRIPVRRDRDWMAATLQLIVPWYKAGLVRVCFGTPCRAEGGSIHQQLIAEMHTLIVHEQGVRRG